MARNNVPKEDEFVLCLSFHIPEEESFGSALAHIEKLMQENFVDAKKLDYDNEYNREIFYSIPKPVFASQEDLSNFFVSIKKVMTATSSWTPHFTQVDKEKIVS